MQISFGAKIPVNTCNIFDIKNKSFIKATVYEIECSDKADVDYMNAIGGFWIYKDAIFYGARTKYDRLTGEDSIFWHRRYDYEDKFFTLETPNQDVACMCEVEPHKKYYNVYFLESEEHKQYKYAGQSMLASIAKTLLGSEKRLKVAEPAESARKFYSDKCRFKDDKTNLGYELLQEDIPAFIQRTEKKTQGKISKFI